MTLEPTPDAKNILPSPQRGEVARTRKGNRAAPARRYTQGVKEELAAAVNAP